MTWQWLFAAQIRRAAGWVRYSGFICALLTTLLVKVHRLASYSFMRAVFRLAGLVWAFILGTITCLSSRYATASTTERSLFVVLVILE